MARRMGRNYKLVNAMTKNMGATGDQVLLGTIDKADAQGVDGWVNNVVCTAMANDAEADTIGITLYATTSSTWSDNQIITARAGAVGTTLNLPVRRKISLNATQSLGNEGLVYIWAEISNTVNSEECRFVLETWGKFIVFTEA